MFAYAEQKVPPQTQYCRLCEKKQLIPGVARVRRKKTDPRAHKPSLLHTHASLKRKLVLRKPGDSHTRAIFGTALFTSPLSHTLLGLHNGLDWPAFFHYFPHHIEGQTRPVPNLTLSKYKKCTLYPRHDLKKKCKGRH